MTTNLHSTNDHDYKMGVQLNCIKYNKNPQKMVLICDESIRYSYCLTFQIKIRKYILSAYKLRLH